MFYELHAAIEDRLRGGDSARAIARRAGLPLRAVQNIVEGHQPSLDRAAKICEVLGLEAYIGPPRDQWISGELGADNSRKDAAEQSRIKALRDEVAKLAARIDPDSGTMRRIREPDLIIPTLIFLSRQEDGRAKTTEIVAHMEERFRPSGEDAETLKGRKDSRFSQIVRNMVSHRKDAGSFIHNGYADYLSDLQGLEITDKGRNLLKEIVNEG